MKRVLFCTLFLVACSSKSDAPTAPPGDSTSVEEAAEPVESAAPAEGTEPAEGAEPSEGAEPAAAGEAAGGKNIQALPADWSKKQVKGYMKEIAKGLDLTCDDCHDMSAMDKDTEMKTKARAMIEMTMALDKEHLGGKGLLSCATCHQGKRTPENTN